MMKAVDRILAVLAFVGAIFAVALAGGFIVGCSTTTIRTPDGSEYSSSRDSDLTDLEFERIVQHPDGTIETTRASVGKAQGKASAVVSAQYEGAANLIDKGFELGKAAAGAP